MTKPQNLKIQKKKISHKKIKTITPKITTKFQTKNPPTTQSPTLKNAPNRKNSTQPQKQSNQSSYLSTFENKP